MKNGFLAKNCLTLLVSGREKKNAQFRARYLFWPKIFAQKHCKPGNAIKIVVSAAITKNKE